MVHQSATPNVRKSAHKHQAYTNFIKVGITSEQKSISGKTIYRRNINVLCQTLKTIGLFYFYEFFCALFYADRQLVVTRYFSTCRVLKFWVDFFNGGSRQPSHDAYKTFALIIVHCKFKVLRQRKKPFPTVFIKHVSDFRVTCTGMHKLAQQCV